VQHVLLFHLNYLPFWTLFYHFFTFRCDCPALERRFNGKIFPIDFTQKDAPTDLHVQLTASIFMGDESILSQTEAIVRQLHLDFQAYDFAYIPIEMLSAVYEQFIEDSKSKGAVYTPEILADYLLSEVDAVKP